MDIRQLELFLAVMEYGSITKAAKNVYLTPGAVSLQLQSLSMELQTDLFVRSGKRFTPTPAAERLAHLAKDLMRRVRGIELEFANDPLADTRPFHLATGATTLIHHLDRPLRFLRQQYPHASVRITVSSTEDMVQGLLERRFDLAIISLPYESRKELTILPLFEEELLIIRPAAKAVRGTGTSFISPEELANARFILYPMRSNMRSMIEGFFSSLGIAPQVLMEAEDTEVIKKLVETGFGYSILPESALRAQPRFFQNFRVRGHQLVRSQAVAIMKTEYTRALTLSVAMLLQQTLGTATKPVRFQTGAAANG